jgi:hydrogenase nickel incorporation protein HypA/HybF
MHELGIIRHLVSLAENELDKADCRAKVKSVEIRVGTLSGVSPEALEFAFNVVAPSTKLKGAHLLISECKPVLLCRKCETTREIDEILFTCPACGGSDVEIAGGRELHLESIEVED